MLLLMDERVCGFTELEANVARKIVGKKLMDKVPELKDMIFKKSKCSVETTQYIWDTAIGVQMGYSFSLPHTVAYTIVALQELNIYNKFPSSYWNAACLIVNSGGDHSDTVDYAKIARAIGRTKRAGIDVSHIDINQSDTTFKPSEDSRTILYGLKPVAGINQQFAKKIIQNRPYASMEDFIQKTSPTKSQMVSLIKAGAFDELEGVGRRDVMFRYIKDLVEPKKTVNLRNLPRVIEYDLLDESLSSEYAVYEYNRYLKEVCEREKGVFYLDERAQSFYLDRGYPEYLLELDPSTNEPTLLKKEWDKIYSSEMDSIRDWMRDSSEQLKIEMRVVEIIQEYENLASGTVPKWEMESMSFYHSGHELDIVDYDEYGIVDFSSLDRNSEVEKYFNIGGKNIPIFKTSRIIGTVIGKNSVKGTVDLLTPEGDVVLLKMSKEKFSGWDRQITETNPDGSKRVVERGWFRRGNLLMVNGRRRGDQFLPKAYRNTGFEEVYLITGVNEDGTLVLRSERGIG